MSLPKILPISWSISDDRNHQAAVPICSTAPSPFVAPVEACVVEARKGVADFRRPGDSLPSDLNNLNSSNNSDLSTLQTFYNSLTLPTTPIALNPHTTIHNLPLFISTHLSILKRYPSTREFLPYLYRLYALKAILSKSP